MKMRKVFKRLTAAVLALSMAVSSVPAGAETEEYLSSEELDIYLNDVVPVYLEARGFSNTSTYYVSNVFDILSDDIQHSSYAFVFENDNMIGKLELHKTDGKYNSSFDTYIQDEVVGMYSRNENIAFVADEEYIFVVSETDSVALDVDETIKYKKRINLQSPIKKTYAIEFPKASTTYSMRSATLGYKTLNNFPFVPNEQVNNSYVLCWAACVAMAINYLDNRGYNPLSASDVSTKIGTTSGTVTAVKNAYKAYNHPVTLSSSAATPDRVFQDLSNGKPLTIFIEDSSKGLYHAVEIYSVYIYTDKTVYTFYDPSILSGAPESVVVNGNPTQTSSAFAYIHKYNNITYTMSWTDTFYIN